MKTMTKYGVGNKLFSYNKGWREDIAPAFIVITQEIRTLELRVRRALL